MHMTISDSRSSGATIYGMLPVPKLELRLSVANVDGYENSGQKANIRLHNNFRSA